MKHYSFKDVQLALVTFGCLLMVFNTFGANKNVVVVESSVCGKETSTNKEAIPPYHVRKAGKLKFSSQRTLTQPGSSETLEIIYQCYGHDYDKFTTKLREFSKARIADGLEPKTWGHPDFYHLKPNSSILFFGNSHTRQMAFSFLSQRYRDIVSFESINLPWEKRINKERKFVLRHNITVYVVTNSAIPHSPVWYELLEQSMGRKLESLDAIVLGLFNSCTLDANTTYAAEMMANSGISCLTQEGPQVADVAAHYSGPLAFVSMFSTHRSNLEEDAREMVQDLQKDGRTNVDFIYARQYVEEMDMECAYANDHKSKDCQEGDKARHILHRCVGRRGGHPDLIAWNVREWLRENAE